ncbi:MFS transporter [bacterium]|nr:MFS transporter [bacterium]
MSDRLLSGPFLRATLANFFFFLSFASYFLLPLFLHGLGGSEGRIGAVMGSSGLASLLVLPLVGTTIDRVGRRPFLLAGAAAMSAASIGFQFVHAIGPAAFALRILQGASFAAAFTATTTFAAELAPRARRARALGVFGLSTMLTHAIAPGLGEELVRRAGFPALFAAAAVCSLIALVIAAPLPEPRHVALAVAPGARRLQPIHWLVAATMTLAGMGFGCVMTFIPTYVTSHGLGRVAYFFAAYTSTAILTRLIGAGASDRVGRARVILPSLLLLGGAIFWLGRVEGLISLVAAGALFGVAQGLSYPTLHAFLVDVASEAQLGRTQALFNGAFNLGVTGSAFAFGIVAERSGYRTMFSLAALAPLVAAAIFAAGARRRPH